MSISFNLSSLQTQAVMEVFFLAAAMHPDSQKAAQAELDAVIGPDRLPEFSDYDHLPYMRAFVKEVLRWHIVLPMGLPHATVEDDEYNGYFIPGGTVVNVNVWYVVPPRSSGPVLYSDGTQTTGRCPGIPKSISTLVLSGQSVSWETSLPETPSTTYSASDEGAVLFALSFLAPSLSDVLVSRACPGRHFAAASLFIYCSSVLHAFDVMPPKDENGNPVAMQYRPKGDLAS